MSEPVSAARGPRPAFYAVIVRFVVNVPVLVPLRRLQPHAQQSGHFATATWGLVLTTDHFLLDEVRCDKQSCIDTLRSATFVIWRWD